MKSIVATASGLPDPAEIFNWYVSCTGRKNARSFAASKLSVVVTSVVTAGAARLGLYLVARSHVAVTVNGAFSYRCRLAIMITAYAELVLSPF